MRRVTTLLLALSIAACSSSDDGGGNTTDTDTDTGEGSGDVGTTDVGGDTDSGTPDVGDDTPDVGEDTPDVGEDTPDVGEDTPDVGEDTPDVGEDTPDVGTDTADVGEDTPDVGTDTADVGTDTGVPSEVSRLPAEAASAICEALDRCCDATSYDQYFDSLLFNERLADFADVFPPSRDTCADVLGEALAVAPFDRWIEEVEAGRVTFLPGGVDTCVSALEDAACGLPLQAALYDGTCFGVAAPVGGASQRRMFQRTTPPGGECASLNDGVGGSIYGTCDPTAGWCCIADGDGCTFGGGSGVGSCAVAGDVGDDCAFFGDPMPCATGLECDFDSSTCVRPPSGFLTEGDTCATESFELLGTCVGSWCDLLGTRLCEARRPDGEACTFAEECASGACLENLCAPPTFCVGVDT